METVKYLDEMSIICFKTILGSGNKWNKIGHKSITVKDWQDMEIYFTSLFTLVYG